jgi:16S rRNA (cytidine1402-2'-O)-methyltransferase
MPADRQPQNQDRHTARSFMVDPAALAPGLYVVATPIGNLADVTLRALTVLAAADLVLCEDTRVTRRLLERYGLKPPLLVYHDHNAAKVRPRVLARLGEGAAVALVSDAGTPLVSDPGYKLVEAAIAAGHRVFPVPGASAAIAALIAAGLPTDRFFFEGYLPAKSAARKSRIAEIERVPATLVLYESGQRLAASLAALAAGLGPRPAAVCRELTKFYEEVRRDSLEKLATHYGEAEPPKGEIAIVIGPPVADAPTLTPVALDARLKAALAKFSLKDAAAAVAAETGLPRREIYRRALALAGDRENRR